MTVSANEYYSQCVWGIAALEFHRGGLKDHAMKSRPTDLLRLLDAAEFCPTC